MRRSAGCMLTLGRNYNSLVCSSPGPGRYLTPWRVPASQRSTERNYSALLRRRVATAQRVSIQQYDYNPCELRKAGVFLPQVSEEMASAVAVAAKYWYRRRIRQWKEGIVRRDTNRRKSKQKEKFTLHTSDLKTEYAGLFYVYGQVYVLYHGGGQIQY